MSFSLIMIANRLLRSIADVAWKDNCPFASIAIVVRNFKGKIIDGVPKKLIRANPLAEKLRLS